jgi:hypothetical protein
MGNKQIRLSLTTIAYVLFNQPASPMTQTFAMMGTQLIPISEDLAEKIVRM